MTGEYNLAEMDKQIRKIREAAEELLKIGGGIEAVKKNLARLLASTKMLELNISDVKDFV